MDIEIKAEGVYSFKSAENRQNFVKMASCVVSAGGRAFEPYQMNASTSDKEWVIDANNDWFLIFDLDDTSMVRIRHRNGDQGALKSLAGWLAYRWHGKVVTPEALAL